MYIRSILTTRISFHRMEQTAACQYFRRLSLNNIMGIVTTTTLATWSVIVRGGEIRFIFGCIADDMLKNTDKISSAIIVGVPTTISQCDISRYPYDSSRIYNRFVTAFRTVTSTHL